MPINLDGMSCPNAKPPAAPDTGKPPTPPKAPNGGFADAFRGAGPGTPGTSGASSSGVTTQNGTRGGDGADAGSLHITTNNLVIDPSDLGWLSARGGNGGPGGDALTPGGDGGDGGDGGNGSGLQPGREGGEGGWGGPGASGGQGGSGGKGGTLIISYSGVPVPYHSTMVAGGRPGLPGQGAPGGAGGAGGRGGDGPFGRSPDGNPGGSKTHLRPNGGMGSPGAMGAIWINGVQLV